MPKISEHDDECTIKSQKDNVITEFIESGCCIQERRKFREMCMISKQHPFTSVYFSSNASCRTEEFKHLIRHYYMIHPFSMISLYWEFFMFLVFLARYIMIPVDAVVKHNLRNPNIIIMNVTLDMIFLVDIVVIFFRGYYDSETGFVILRPSKIAKRYMKTYFIFDVLSSAHSWWWCIGTSYTDIVGLAPSVWYIYFQSFLKICSRLKIIRMHRWINALTLFRLYKGYSSYLFKAIKVSMVFFVLICWSASILFMIDTKLTFFEHSMEELMTTNTFQHFLVATEMLVMASYGNEYPTIIVHYVCSIFFMCFGFGLQIFLYTQLVQVWTKYVHAESKHESLIKQVTEYEKYKELPPALRKKMYSYFNFKYHKQFFAEEDVFRVISPILRNEVMDHITKGFVNKVEFLKYLNEDMRKELVDSLKCEIFLPGDVIIRAGKSASCMYFIYHGIVAVYSPMGTELCHLEDGDHFGEIALVFNERRTATIIAVTPCEVFILERKKFRNILEPFPEVNEKIVGLATKRLSRAYQQT